MEAQYIHSSDKFFFKYSGTNLIRTVCILNNGHCKSGSKKKKICWELKMFWLLYMNYLILKTTLWSKVH